MKSYQEGNQLYNEIKTGKRKQYAIETKQQAEKDTQYIEGYLKGFSEGYKRALQNNKIG